MTDDKDATITYCKLMKDGRYEYGRIEKAEDRRKDQMVRVGITDTFDEAERLRDALTGDQQ